MNTMKAVYIQKYGRSDVMETGDIAVPSLQPNQVLIKVKAVSLNPRDWLLMRGIYPFKKLAEPFPIILGSDMSGTVVSTGAEATKYKVGDDVFGMQPIKGKFGALAEYAAIKESAVTLKPAALSHTDAAAMPCAGMTSFQAIRDLAKVKTGETILINGASGGVGTYAIQMAKAAGAYVIAVCGPTNQKLCTSLGADETIDYKSENFEHRSDSYDVVYDVIGRSSPDKCRKSLKKKGRYISTIPSPAMFLKAKLSQITRLFGLNKSQTSHLILVKPDGHDLAAMARLIENGKMKSVIDSTYPFANVKAAFEKIQSWRAKGKVIVEICK